MKIAINITRETLAGITSTNLSLLDYLHGSDSTFVGIELNTARNFQSPVLYRHLSPEWFNHQIISMCDLPLKEVLKRCQTLHDFEREFSLIITHVRAILQKEKPDIVLINGTYYIPWVISVAAQKEKIPVVLWYAGVYTKETEHMKPKARRIFSEMERSIVRRAKRIVFPSQICQDLVYARVSNSSVVKEGVIMPNPISPIFTRLKTIEESVERRIAFVGRYSRIKNIEAFCAIHKKLLKKGWTHEATIVSDIPKKDLKKIPKSIKIIPSMSPLQLKTFYSTQGLIISPSFFETFGNMPIEAVSVGIPVLVNMTMGCSEVLTSAGLKNMVIDFNDEAAVLERVMSLCGQHVLPRQINNLRKRIDTKYVANKIISVLRSVNKIN